MSIKIQINGIDKLLSRIQVSNDLLASSLTDKMTDIMTRLRQKTLAKLPSSGVLNENVSEPQVAYGGGVIKGFISWLGGDPSGEYSIKPLGLKGTRGEFRETFEGTGRIGWRSGHMKGAIKRTGRDILAFEIAAGGKTIFTKFVEHHHYFPGPTKMTDALDEMQGEIKAGLMETLSGFKANLRS